MRKLKGREESQDGPVSFLRFLENRDFVTLFCCSDGGSEK